MKKIYYLSIAILAFSLLIYCSPDPTNASLSHNGESQEFSFSMSDKQYIQTAPLDEKLDYKRHHLNNLADWLLDNNDEFTEIVLDEISNGNDRIPIDTIYSRMNNIQPSSVSIVDFELALDAFTELDSIDYYPAISVYDVQKFTNATTKPIYAIEDYDEENQIERAVAYGEDARGNFSQIAQSMDETTHGNENIVRLVVVACEGLSVNYKSPTRSCNGSGGSSGGGGTTFFKLRVNKMTIKDLKEIWPFRSDIHIKGYKFYGLPTGSGQCGLPVIGGSNCYSYDGNRIVKWKRSWQNTERTQNYTLANFASSSDVNQTIFYVIFENDVWPAPKKTAQYNFPNGHYRQIEFNSYESSYSQEILSMDQNNTYGFSYAKTFSTDQNDIKYNLNFGL
ncbi:MAG: hypothetical protein CMC35_02260 [Flavobacteriaceae bacterium]|nr:hypothetical protein [Flavobacteriaceae bacterium]|tara:strand:+ start:28814 stop:29992 length:1179 start_codon:yes stop_codon:yes gene_type:complete